MKGGNFFIVAVLSLTATCVSPLKVPLTTRRLANRPVPSLWPLGMALSSSKTSAKVALLNLLGDKNVYQNRKSLSTDDCAKVDEAILKLDAEMSIKIPTSNRSLNGVWDLRYIQGFWLAGPLKMLNDQIGIQIEQPRADFRTRIGLFGIRVPVIEMKATLETKNATSFLQQYSTGLLKGNTRELCITYLDEDVLIMRNDENAYEIFPNSIVSNC